MTFIINPGSKIGSADSKKWTNTHETARGYANKWFLQPMLKEGFKDIEVTDTKKEVDGRWLFIFRHEITGVEVELEVHGIDNLEEYQKEFIFSPRVYWNGSSSSEPQIEQFAKEGYEPVMTYKRKD